MTPINPHAKDKDGNPIPLVGISVELTLQGNLCFQKLLYLFRNEKKHSLEATALIPKPYRSVVTGLTTHGPDGKRVGVIYEKEEAFGKYDDAVEEGITSALVEMESEDQLTLALGAFGAGEGRIIELDLVTDLEEVDGLSTLRIPLTVEERYAPIEVDDEKVDRLSMPILDRVPYAFSLKGVVKGATHSVACMSHEITTKYEETQVTFKLEQKKELPDRDLVLEFEKRINEEEEEEVEAYIGENSEGESFIQVVLRPNLESEVSKQSPNTISYCLDCSGSMNGNMQEAVRALQCCIRSMEENTMFNITFFGSNFEKLFDRDQPFNEKTLKQAMNRLEHTSADMGGTEMLTALKASWKGQSESRALVLITDGATHDIDRILSEAKMIYGLRCFTLGIGYGASQALMEGLADATGGASEILHGDGELENVVMRQFSRIFQPRLDNVRLVSKPRGLLDPEPKLGPIYVGDGLSLMARVKKEVEIKSIKVTAEGPSGDHTWKAIPQKTKEGNALGKIWAHRCAIDLESESGIFENHIQRRRAPRKLRKATDLAIKYQVLSRSTGMVVVDEKSKETEDGRGKFIKVPMQKMHKKDVTLACLMPMDVDAAPRMLSKKIINEVNYSEKSYSHEVFSDLAMSEPEEPAYRKDMEYMEQFQPDGLFDCWDLFDENERKKVWINLPDQLDDSLRKRIASTLLVLEEFKSNPEWRRKHRVAIKKADLAIKQKIGNYERLNEMIFSKKAGLFSWFRK
jgi:hypothetical protein